MQATALQGALPLPGWPRRQRRHCRAAEAGAPIAGQPKRPALQQARRDEGLQQPDLQPLAPVAAGFDGMHRRGPVGARLQPFDVPAVGRQTQAVGVVDQAAPGQCRHRARQRRAVDQQADLGIDRRRARIQVDRADEQPAAVDRRHLGMQRRVRRADAAAARHARTQLGADLVDAHPRLQHRQALLRTGRMGPRLVGGADRVGDEHDAAVVLGRAGSAQQPQAGPAGDEVRRRDVHVLLRRREQRQHLLRHRRPAAAGGLVGAVGDEQLVVHAVVDEKPVERAEDAPCRRTPAHGEGVEDAQFHVGMVRQPGEQRGRRDARQRRVVDIDERLARSLRRRRQRRASRRQGQGQEQQPRQQAAGSRHGGTQQVARRCACTRDRGRGSGERGGGRRMALQGFRAAAPSRAAAHAGGCGFAALVPGARLPTIGAQ
ncbi:MAG TPA: hypothetical protein PLB26_01280, partial [Rubrivivax sp.]|nr:hypothetical protein [Rubrivivax sp.]